MNRLSKFRKELELKQIDAAIILKPANYFYLSGFSGTFACLLITQQQALLLTDPRYTLQASEQAPLFCVNEFRGGFSDALVKMISELGIQKLGFEENFLTFDKYSEYKEKLQGTLLQPLEGIVENIKVCKDEIETAILKEAVNIADRAFDHILKYISPGVAEKDIAAELEYFMKKNGAVAASFETIVASGYRAALPHGVASDKKINKGEAVILDYGAYYRGYCSDITRTVFAGVPDKKLIEIYSIVKKAQEICLENIKAGMTGKQADSYSRDYIKEYGYGSNFGHGTGHGFGTEIHEEPKLNEWSDRLLCEGMAVTVEPGIYVKDLGGVRIEDAVIIKDNGILILTEATKEMLIL